MTLRELSIAPRRQSILTEAHNALEAQRRIVRLVARRSEKAPPPPGPERARFAAGVDLIPARPSLLGGVSTVIVLAVRDLTEEGRAGLRGRVVKVLRNVGLPGEDLLTEVRRVLDASARSADSRARRAGVTREESPR